MSYNFQDKVIGHLPDGAYAKGKDSNIYRLFQIISPELDLLAQTFDDLRDCVDMDKAFGYTLDKIGFNVNQMRGTVDDETLRTLIKAKITIDSSEGTIATVLWLVDFMLGDSSGASSVRELYNDPDDPEPAAFQIIIPTDTVLNAGITLNHFISLLQYVRAAGVRIVANFGGTFQLWEIDEHGEESDIGFADEDQTTGGELGILYDPDFEDPLPI